MSPTCPKLTIKEKYWLAGVLDGEGTITYRIRERKTKSNNTDWSLAVGTTNKKFIERIKEIIQCGCLVEIIDKKRNHKKMYYWRIDSNYQTYHILKQLYPILIIKKSKAKKVMEYIKKNINGVVK